MLLDVLLLPSANEVWGKVMFSQMSVHRGMGVCLWAHPPPDPEAHPQPKGPPPPGPRDIPLDIPTPCTHIHGQQTGGKHPTGMLSCLLVRNPTSSGVRRQNDKDDMTSYPKQSISAKRTDGQTDRQTDRQTYIFRTLRLSYRFFYCCFSVMFGINYEQHSPTLTPYVTSPRSTFPRRSITFPFTITALIHPTNPSL